jgi:hypothetical protein
MTRCSPPLHNSQEGTGRKRLLLWTLITQNFPQAEQQRQLLEMTPPFPSVSLEHLMDPIRNMNWTRWMRTFIVCGLGRGLSIERTGARRGRLTSPGQPLLPDM